MTNKIEKITRPMCKILRDGIDADLKSLGDKYGLTVATGNATYDGVSVTFKVKLSLDGVDLRRRDFERCAMIFKLTKDDFGADLNYCGRHYRLVGLKPRSPKYPVLGERDGQTYKLPEAAVSALQS